MYESILVPLDGSEHAAKALEHAAALASGKLTLLSVTPTVDEMFGKKQADPADANEMTDEMLAREAYDEARAKAQHYLQQASQSLSGKPFQVSTQLAEGAPADTIVKVANDIGADLIVISAFGTSASTTPSKTGIFGRVADAVLKNSKAPVLVVKPFV